MSPPPDDDYRARLEARGATHAALNASDLRFSQARLAAFGLLVLVAVLAWLQALSAIWLILPTVALVVLIRRHDRVIRARDATARAMAFYERGLARIEDRWMGGGSNGDRFADDHHLYANDLDLFGRGSLFELLSIARTRAGEDVLAAWLKTAADRAEISERQHAIAELTP